MLKELLMSSTKGEVKKKQSCIGRNLSCLMTSECWLSHIADSSFSCYYPVALSDTLGHEANEDQVLVSPVIVNWLRLIPTFQESRLTSAILFRVGFDLHNASLPASLSGGSDVANARR